MLLYRRISSNLLPEKTRKKRLFVIFFNYNNFVENRERRKKERNVGDYQIISLYGQEDARN